MEQVLLMLKAIGSMQVVILLSAIGTMFFLIGLVIWLAYLAAKRDIEGSA